MSETGKRWAALSDEDKEPFEAQVRAWVVVGACTHTYTVLGYRIFYRYFGCARGPVGLPFVEEATYACG